MGVSDREHLERLLAEQDRRYEARFEAQEKAVSAALAAAEKAVAKAELAAEKRFEAVNEFRGQLSDQAASFMPRAEASLESTNTRERIDALATRLETIALRFERGEGTRGGLKEGWGILVAGSGIALAIAALVVAIVL